MANLNKLINVLKKIFNLLVVAFDRLTKIISSPTFQSQLTGWFQTLLVFIKKHLQWTVDSRGLRKNKPAMVFIVVVLLLAVYLFSTGNDLDDLKETGELVVVSRESDTTWYQNSNGPAGPEYDYMMSFADFLGVDLRFEMRDTNRAVLAAITDNQGHLAAAGITRDPWLEEQGIIFGPDYQAVDQQVVCRRNQGRLPGNLEALIDKDLVVIADSSQEAYLFELQEEHDELSWESVEEETVDDLLEQVWRKEVDCTIANSHEVKIKRRVYPELQVAFTLRENQALAWTLSPEWEFLSNSIETWLESIERDGSLLVLQDRHYGDDEFDYVDMRSFIRRIKSRLPKLEPLFKEASEQYGMPWTFLAAQAYQESHWNRRAKSPTGVRGIMMLTLVTAREMGVESRLDVKQSIMGGAKYLKKLEARVPDSVKGSNRWWYALAAYNVGMGHVHDARGLTESLNLDPDSWLDLKGVLPLLSKKKYYKDLKYGYARGAEPVTYVRRIRNYENILRAQLVRAKGVHAG